VVPVPSPSPPRTIDGFDRWLYDAEPEVAKVLGELIVPGATLADVFVRVHQEVRITPDAVTANESRGLAVRVAAGDRVGFAFSEEPALAEAIGAARAARAQVLGGEASRGSNAPALSPVRLPNHYTASASRPYAFEREQEILRKLVEQCRALDPDVIVRADWEQFRTEVLIADERGRLVRDVRPLSTLTLVCGLERSGRKERFATHLSGRWDIDGWSAERLHAFARRGVDGINNRLRAAQAPTGTLPIVLLPEGGGIFAHEVVGHPFEASNVPGAPTRYASEIGNRVASELLDVVDDRTVSAASGSLNADDEGRVGRRTRVMKNGKVVSLLHDRLSAALHGVEPTGSGRRGTHRLPPRPRMGCTLIESGPHDPEEIIASVERGVAVETLAGGKTSDHDFHLFVRAGWLIEKGKLATPVRDTVVHGEQAEALQNIRMVGNDAHIPDQAFQCSTSQGERIPVSTGSPTIRIDGLTVSPPGDEHARRFVIG
jgi:TldD protein